jgi:hypothetical protein
LGAACTGTVDHSSASADSSVVSFFQRTPHGQRGQQQQVGHDRQHERTRQLHRQAHTLHAGALQRVHHLDDLLVAHVAVGADDHGRIGRHRPGPCFTAGGDVAQRDLAARLVLVLS